MCVPVVSEIFELAHNRVPLLECQVEAQFQCLDGDLQNQLSSLFAKQLLHRTLETSSR